MKPAAYALIFAISTSLLSHQAAAASVKEILEEAFDSPTGNVNAPVDGQMTDMIRRTMPIQGDVMAEVKTIKHFKEKDCRRFSVTLKAMYAPGSGARGPVPLPTMEMNYCKGGSFPKEGYDPDAGKKLVEQMDAYARERAEQMPEQPAAPSTLKSR